MKGRDGDAVSSYDGRSGLPRHPWNVTRGSHCRDLLAVLDAARVRKAVLIEVFLRDHFQNQGYRPHPPLGHRKPS